MIRKKIKVTLQQLHKLLVVRHILLPLKDLAEPCQLLVLAARGHSPVACLLVFPVRCDTVFGNPVHLKGSDLDLKRRTRGTDQRRVEGLVHICLWHGDIVLKPARHRFIHLMDHTERCIAVLDRINDDAHREQVVDLVDRLSLILHLFIYAKEMLYTPVDLGVDPGIHNVLCNLIHDVLHILLAHIFSERDLLHQIIIRLRLQIFQ